MAAPFNLTPDSIDALDDTVEAFDICESLEIYTDDIDELDDLKERLRLHYEAEQSLAPRLEKAADVFAELREDDTRRRDALREIYTTLKRSMSILDSNIIQRLTAEKVISGDVGQDLRKRVATLETGNCPILVAGETSSGKSTLLNLLLGKKILPEAHLSCTAAITRIMYGEQPKVMKITHQPDGSQRTAEVTIKNPEDLCSALEPVLFPKGEARESIRESFSVDIYYPFDLLKSGVYIIDSPGIGESGSMDDVVLKFIANNDVFAFIYVIMTDKSGGVQEDRLQKLLRQLQAMRDAAGEAIFDPGCAVFVCNRWDLVPDDSKEKALQKVRSAVSEGWNRPMNSSKQIFTLSAKMAWQHSQAGYMTHDYRRLIAGIKNLIPASLQRRTEHLHRWAAHLSERVIDYAHQYLKSANLSRDELEAKHKSQKQRLDKLETKSKDILEKLEGRLKSKCEEIAVALSRYLNQDSVEDSVCSWTLEESPFSSDWNRLEEKIDDAICKRIIAAIRRWEEKTKHFEVLQRELFREFTTEFQLIESELRTIENLLETSPETSPNNSGDMSNYMTLSELIDEEVNKMPIVDLNVGEKIALGVFSPIILPVGALGMLLASPALLFIDVKRHVRKRKEKHMLKLYEKDKRGFLGKHSLDALKIMAKPDVTRAYVNTQLEVARDHLKMMRESIPQLISSTRQYMQTIQDDQRSAEQLMDTYSPVVREFSKVHMALEDFVVSHIFSYDFSDSDVEPDIDSLRSQTPHKGNWTEVFPAILRSSRHPPPKITVKRYMGTVTSKTIRQEIIEMRKLKRQNRKFIPTILGTFMDKTTELPSIVISPRLNRLSALTLTSSGGRAGVHMRGQLVNLLLKEPVGFLNQLADALAFLHKNGLVCMDMCLDTVMVSDGKEKELKLVNISRPTILPIPDPFSPIGSLVYHPISVLLGRKQYDADANIYALGLMMWEIWHKNHVFKTERGSAASVFISGIQEGRFPLEFESRRMDLTLEKHWEETMRACLSENITIQRWGDQMHEIRELLTRKETML